MSDIDEYVHEIKEEYISENSKNISNLYKDTFQQNQYKEEPHSEIMVEYSGINPVYIKTEDSSQEEEEDIDDMYEDEDPLNTMDEHETIVKTEEDLDTFDFSTMDNNSEDIYSDDYSTDSSKHQLMYGSQSGGGVHSDQLLFACEFCSFKATTKISFDRHILVHSRDISDAGHFSASKKKLAPPPATGARAGRGRKFAGGIAATSSKKYTGVKFYYCKMCPFRTNFRARLAAHKLSHSSGTKILSCGRCTFQTQQMDALKKHMVDHARGKRFKCTQCDFRTSVKLTLVNHQDLEHNTSRLHVLFSCEYCSYKTRFPTNINHHYLSHGGDNPFNCDWCPFKTNTKDKLDSHIIDSHVEEDRTPVHRCSVCPYKASDMADINKHKLKHSINLFCDMCPFKTCDSDRLKRHSNTHTDEPRVCNICNYVNARRDGLIAHIRTVHSDHGRREEGSSIARRGTRKSPRNVAGKINMRERMDDEDY